MSEPVYDRHYFTCGDDTCPGEHAHPPERPRSCPTCREEHPWGTPCTRDPREVRSEKVQGAYATMRTMLRETYDDRNLLSRRIAQALAYIEEHPEGTGDLEAILRGEYDRD